MKIFNIHYILTLVFTAFSYLAFAEEEEGWDKMIQNYWAERVGDPTGYKTLERKMNDVLEDWTQAKTLESLNSENLAAFRKELHGNRTNVWRMHPDELNQLHQAVEPLRELAIQLASSEDSSHKYHSASILPFLEPTEQTKTTLLKLARDESLSTAGTALNTIFGMGWDTPELRAEMVRHLEHKFEGKPYRGLAMTHVGEWGINEAVPILIKILEKSYQDPSFPGKAAITQLMALRGEAKEALPLLEQILTQRVKDGDADFREIESLEFAIQAIKRNRPREKSWRDYNKRLRNKEASQGDRYTANKGTENDLNEEKETKPEKNKTLWTILGVLLVGVFALLLKTFKNKSTS